MSSTTETAVVTLKALAKRPELILSGSPMLPRSKQDKWQRESNGWRCTLCYQGRAYSFDFWQGKGIKENPTAHGVLYCLLSDAQAGRMGFKEFCGELGYDTDSRTAEQTWKACQKVNAAMKRLLGSDYETFLYAERD